MPAGTYHHLDPGGHLVGVEAFSCAPGPMGWRYVSHTTDPDGRPIASVDVTCDDAWRQIRVVVDQGGWTVRGGVAGNETVWLRAPSGAEPTAEVPEQSAVAAGFTGRSPAFLVVTAKLLALELLDRRRIHLLALTEPAAAVLPVDQGWALVDLTEHETETVPLPVARYEVADLATAERSVVHVAGDVILEAPALELATLDSPPTLS